MWHITNPAKRNITAGFCIFFQILFFTGCPLVTFEYLDVSCSVRENQDYFNEEYILLSFSQKPDKKNIEDQIQFQAGNRAAAVKFIWQGSDLLVRPEIPWSKGQLYRFSLEGIVRMEDGRDYTVRVLRTFHYGEAGNIFELISSTPGGNTLVFSFSRPVLVTSFNEKFSLSPYSDCHVDFSSDKTIVTVIPKNGWAANTIYQWSVKELISGDGYFMEKEYSGDFTCQIDTTLPVVETICPVSYDPVTPVWYTGKQLDGELLEGQAVGFVFSKPMDMTAVQNGIRFTPPINGYFIKTTDESFVFIPEDSYQLRTEYRLTLSNSITDTSGIQLYADTTVFFTTANTYLEITGISFDDTNTPLATDGTIIEHAILSSNRLKTIIDFSTEIPQNKRKDTVDGISLTVLFPNSASNPKLLSAQWSLNGSQLSLLWSGFTISTGGIINYYILTIPGGKTGVSNAAGEYLKEDVCVIFKAM
jgi:hypothetical protein